MRSVQTQENKIKLNKVFIFYLFHDVFEGVVKPVIKGDESLASLVHCLEVLLAMGNALLGF
jgi:hypothetical protein